MCGLASLLAGACAKLLEPFRQGVPDAIHSVPGRCVAGLSAGDHLEQFFRVEQGSYPDEVQGEPSRPPVACAHGWAPFHTASPSFQILTVYTLKQDFCQY